jgi:hypothetical protein
MAGLTGGGRENDSPFYLDNGAIVRYKRSAAVVGRIRKEGLRMYKVLLVLGALVFMTAAAIAQDMPGSSTVKTAANLTSTGSDSAETSDSAVPEPAAHPEPHPAPPYAASGEFELYPWQVSLGYSFVHFQYVQNKNINYSGLDTSLSYFFTHYVAIEGDVTPGFGGYGKGGAKFCFYGGGLRVARRSGRRWEPWGHVTLGRANVYPQTAFKSTGGLAIQAGGGYDYRMTPRLSFRAEGDWLHSRLFNTTQNNLKMVLGFVFNF